MDTTETLTLKHEISFLKQELQNKEREIRALQVQVFEKESRIENLESELEDISLGDFTETQIIEGLLKGKNKMPTMFNVDAVEEFVNKLS